MKNRFCPGRVDYEGAMARAFDALLTDEEFWRGQRSLENAAKHEIKPTPVIDTLDLLALRKPA